jgi:hypothetical protein
MKRLKAFKCLTLLVSVIAVIFSTAGCEEKRDPDFWGRSYDFADSSESAFAVSTTPDGGYIIAGELSIYSGSGTDMGDLWAAKLNFRGEVVWQKIYSGLAVEIGIDGMSVITSADGGYALMGRTNSFAEDFSPWVLKLDANGNVQWQKTYSGLSHSYAKKLIQTDDGGYMLLTAALNETTVDGEEVLSLNESRLIKLSASGEIDWSRGYTFDNGTEYEMKSMDAAADGGYIMTGTVYDPDSSVKIGYTDAVVLKADWSGNIQWMKSYGRASAFYNAGSVKSVSDGFVIAGSTGTYTTDIRNDFWAAKLDLSGNIIWEKKFDINSGKNEEFSSIDIAADGSYLFAGNTNGYDAADIIIAKINRSGSAVWIKKYDAGAAYAGEIKTTPKGFAVAGYNGYGILISVDVNGSIPDAGSKIKTLTPSLTSTGVVSAVRAVTLSGTAFTSDDTNGVIKQKGITVKYL